MAETREQAPTHSRQGNSWIAYIRGRVSAHQLFINARQLKSTLDVRGADMGADRPVAASSTSVEATAHRIAYALLRPIAFYPQVPPLLSGAADLESI